MALNETELLRKLDFFEPLEQKIIKKIAAMCIVREFVPGEYIVRQGESGLGLYFITAGQARVEIERKGVRAAIAELQAGDFLGELSMIDDKARSASVVCLEDTRCLLLTRDSFTKLVKKYPEIAIQMVRSLAGRIRATNEKVSAPVVAPPPPPVSPAPAAPEAAMPPEVSNGSSGVLQPVKDAVQFYSSSKKKVSDFFIDMFGALYLMKALTRFSAAVVGCPVTVVVERQLPGTVLLEVQNVKVALFPATQDQTLRIEPYADGEFSATIFRPAIPGSPGAVSIVRAQGPVCQRQNLLLHLPAGSEPWLEVSGASAGPPYSCQTASLEAASSRRLPRRVS